MFEELTYVCLDVPEPAASQVMAIRRAHQDDFRAALPAEITVAGSGGVGEFEPGQDPDHVFGVLDALAAKTAPIPASFGPVIRFPGTDIFVLSLRDEGPIRALHHELAASPIRWRPARFDFTPHCTLRSRSPVTDAEAGELLATRPPEPVVLDTLSVYEISRDPDGRLPVICKLLHRVRLGGGLQCGVGEMKTETFPNVTIDTPRLVLRPYQAADAPDVALACRDELIQRWLPLPTPYTDEDGIAWCTQMAPRLRTSGEGIEWAAVRRSDGRLVGSFGLKRTDWRGRTSEIGYWVAPWARGEGLAVEAVQAVARWLLLKQGFERLALRAAPGNVASQRVAEKAGFVREGVARSAGFTNGGRVDLVVFSLIRSDLGEPHG